MLLKPLTLGFVTADTGSQQVLSRTGPRLLPLTVRPTIASTVTVSGGARPSAWSRPAETADLRSPGTRQPGQELTRNSSATHNTSFPQVVTSCLQTAKLPWAREQDPAQPSSPSDCDLEPALHPLRSGIFICQTRCVIKAQCFCSPQANRAGFNLCWF